MEKEKHYNFKDRTGEIIHSPSLGDIQIVAYRGTYDCDIIFINTGDTIKNVSYGNVKSGAIKNVYAPIVFGVGFIGEGIYKSRTETGERTKYYNSWKIMLERCYRKARSNRNNSYKNVTVCEEWHNFQNFAKWYEDNYNPETMKDWQLDKDILVKGNKIYSPETCCFVPQEINIFFIKETVNTGLYPVGVHLNKKSGTFVTRITIFGKRVSLGSFKTVEESKITYKSAKEKYAKDLADKWKNLISDKVYNKLISYTHD